MSDKEPGAFRTISEVATELDLPQHVLRFWESKFSQIRPMKRSSGRRFYRPEDVALVRTIRHMLYDQGYTIRGVQRLLKERGVKGTLAAVDANALPPREEAADAVTALAARSAVTEAGSTSGTRMPTEVVDELRAIADEVRMCAHLLASARSGPIVSQD